MKRYTINNYKNKLRYGVKFKSIDVTIEEFMNLISVEVWIRSIEYEMVNN